VRENIRRRRRRPVYETEARSQRTVCTRRLTYIAVRAARSVSIAGAEGIVFSNPLRLENGERPLKQPQRGGGGRGYAYTTHARPYTRTRYGAAFDRTSAPAPPKLFRSTLKAFRSRNNGRGRGRGTYVENFAFETHWIFEICPLSMY